MIRSMRLLRSFSILVLLAPAAASAEGIQIESREYKLMLDPGKFADNQAAAVERFWNDKGGLKQVIDQHLDRKDGVPRSKGSFELDKERNILFREIKLASTKDCARACLQLGRQLRENGTESNAELRSIDRCR